MRQTKQSLEHPTGYETLESEPLKGGAKSRTLKQSPRQRKRQALEGKVLQYISTKQDELISYEDISRGSGASTQQVGQIVRKLEGEGSIVRSETRPRHGTRYWINGTLPQGGGKNTEPLRFSTKNRLEGLSKDVIKTKVVNAVRATRFTLSTGFRELIGRGDK